MCQTVADYHFAWQDRSFDIGVSVGLVEVTKDSGSAEGVLGAADSACYVAKQHGRGRVHVYSSRDEVLARERGEIQWLQRLQTALKENRFELFVQPIVAVGARGQTGPAAATTSMTAITPFNATNPAMYMLRDTITIPLISTLAPEFIIHSG